MTTETNAYTQVALQLADLEELVGISGEKLAQLLGVDELRYNRWAVGQLKMVRKYADRCEHIKALASTGAPLMYASIIDWESEKIYWQNGKITDHRFTAVADPPTRSATLENWRPGR